MLRGQLVLWALLATGCGGAAVQVGGAGAGVHAGGAGAEAGVTAVDPGARVAVTGAASDTGGETAGTSTPVAGAAASAAEGEAGDELLGACVPYALYVRYEAAPRTAAFDAGAKAFDRASAAYERARYLEAARGFMKAAEGFLAAGDEDDRRWAYGNAVWSWEMTGNLEEARIALLGAAARDPALAEELRQLAAELSVLCPPGR